LIAVLDEEAVRNARGGTAHMVQIARGSGKIDVDIVALKDGAVAVAGA
jgi:hypothetical protein